MINEHFQIVSYSYEPRRPSIQNRNAGSDPSEKRDESSERIASGPPQGFSHMVTGHRDNVTSEKVIEQADSLLQGEESNPGSSGPDVTVPSESFSKATQEMTGTIREVLENRRHASSEQFTNAMHAYSRSGYAVGSTVNKAI